MAKVRSWVGLDVHARSVLAVTIDGESGELRSRRLSGVTSEVVGFCCALPGPTRAAYEAGPTGYGLARALEKTIAELIPGSPWEQTVARLRCLRGIDMLSADGLCAEVGEFERFQKAGQLMSYIGLTPSEDSSGEKRRQGAITKTGSRHARRLLVEAAWHYRRPPAKGQALRRRQDGQPAHIIEISWQAQRRLHNLWQRLDTQRGKRRTIVAVAVARELTGFCWALANAD